MKLSPTSSNNGFPSRRWIQQLTTLLHIKQEKEQERHVTQGVQVQIPTEQKNFF